MSIYDVLTHNVNHGRLFRLSHSLGDNEVRTFYASEDVNKLMTGPWFVPDQSRCEVLRNDFDFFIAGELLNVGMPKPNEHPYKSKSKANFRLLHPGAEEVWELRSAHSEKDQAIRVFGRFADKDVFVALLWHWRKYLGKPTSKQWVNARKATATEWTNRFCAYKPIKGVRLNDYVSNAVSI